MSTLLASDDAENSSYGANNIRRSADGRADDIFELSARAYDLGLRDDAVFWFYNAKKPSDLTKRNYKFKPCTSKVGSARDFIFKSRFKFY
jgi:hypothetical protein